MKRDNVGNVLYCVVFHTSVIKIESKENDFTVGTRHSADEFSSFISLIK